MNQGQTFEQTDFSAQDLTDAEYIKCSFTNCDFSRANLRGADFSECVFNNCDFSLALMDHTALRNIRFVACKLLGINFSQCSNFMFAIACDGCVLDYSSLFQKKMKKAVFNNCSMKQVDFEEADLSMAIFNSCDLTDANFARTDLQKADFRTASNYTLDPEINKMKGAKFNYLGVSGLLAKHNIDIEFE